MSEPHQTQLGKECYIRVMIGFFIERVLSAISHLDKLKVWTKQIRVTLSKHQTVQLPKEGQPDAGLTKDYSNSPLHRFKKPGSKNYQVSFPSKKSHDRSSKLLFFLQNIYPPSSTLHLSNIPPSVEEDQIKEAFETASCPVKAFKFFP